MGINLIDVLLFAVFLTIVGVGYIGGTIRLLLILVAIYLSLVLAGLFYMPAGAWLAGHMAALNLYTAEIVSFFLLSSLGTAALAVCLIKTFHSVKLPRILMSMDQIIGAGLGALVATFAAVILTAILRAIFSAVAAAASMGIEISPLLLHLALQLQSSFMASLFADLSRPLFVLLLPWFPQGLPSILQL